jgi:CHAD domain-containing protein
LRLQRQQARIDFLETLKKFDHDAFRRRSKKAYEEFKTLKKKKVSRAAEEYLRILFAHVRAELFDISDDETLHKIRKRLKSIRNIGQVLETIDPSFTLKDELAKISHAYEKIGQWHDTQELIDSIEKYLADIDDPVALEKTAPLIVALKKRCIYNKRKIEQMLKAGLLLQDPTAFKFVA